MLSPSIAFTKLFLPKVNMLKFFKFPFLFQVAVTLGLCTFACVATAQTATPTTVPATTPDPRKVPTDSEQALINDSKKAIIATGITENYFNTHFKLFHVFDKPSDRRVGWLFTVNEYQTLVSDSIGLNAEGKKELYVHSVSTTLGRTSNIQKTLTRARALRLMGSCLRGPFSDTSVLYGSIEGRAALVLTASRYIDPRSDSEKELIQKRKAERKTVDSQTAVRRGTDIIPTGDQIDERQPKVLLGNINLQTGKCTIGGWARRGVFTP
jgi:hypothetical protein